MQPGKETSSLQRRYAGTESSDAAGSETAVGTVSTVARAVRRQVRARPIVAVAVIVLIILAIASLGINAGLVAYREGGVPWGLSSNSALYAEPVDRRRVTGGVVAKSSLNESAHGSISTGVGSLTSIGSVYQPKFPLFWILTAPKHESTRCVEILMSWGRTIPPDSLVFVGAAEDHEAPTGHKFVALDAESTRKAMKELLAWEYIFAHYPDREWYVKGDDDTFFLVGNMNRYLEEYDPRLPYFLGCKFHLGGMGGIQYVSGGAGYALSHESVKRLANSSRKCVDMFGSAVNEGDLAVSECLQTVGVFPEDTRDEDGRQRFHAFQWDYHHNWFKYGFHINKFWFHDWVWGPMKEGKDCCGENSTVSFHYMSGKMESFKFPVVSTPKKTLLQKGLQEATTTLVIPESSSSIASDRPTRSPGPKSLATWNADGLVVSPNIKEVPLVGELRR